MKLISLTMAGVNEVSGEFENHDGALVSVLFLVSNVDGIRLASPEPNVFDLGSFTVDEVRTIVGAVTSFYDAATHDVVERNKPVADPL